MTAEVRRVLDEIEDVLLRRDQDAKDLVAILAALRGPDQAEEVYFKNRYTIPVRRNAFPRLAESSEEGYSNVGWMLDGPDVLPEPFVETHYTAHIDRAVEALTRGEKVK